MDWRGCEDGAQCAQLEVPIDYAKPADGTIKIAVLKRAATGKRELHLLQRFTASHPTVPIVGVPSLPFEVADLDALHAVAEEITGRG